MQGLAESLPIHNPHRPNSADWHHPIKSLESVLGLHQTKASPNVNLASKPHRPQSHHSQADVIHQNVAHLAHQYRVGDEWSVSVGVQNQDDTNPHLAVSDFEKPFAKPLAYAVPPFQSGQPWRFACQDRILSTLQRYASIQTFYLCLVHP